MSDEIKFHPPRRSKSGVLIVVVSVLIAALAIGSVGFFSGAGWFGYRQILYGVNKIYLLNMGADDLRVSVGGREPVEVAPEGARLVDIMGGETQVVVKKADGSPVATYTVFTDESHALLKLSDAGCLAVSDVGAFYGRGGDNLKIVETLDPKTRIYVPESKNIIWPRETFPKTRSSAGGPVLWVELVGCTLLDEPKFMRGYLDVRLGERLAKARGEKESE